MKNKILQELQTVKNYTNDSIKFITDYINKYAESVGTDLGSVFEELNHINELLDNIEAKLKTKAPKKAPKVKDEDLAGAKDGIKIVNKPEADNE